MKEAYLYKKLKNKKVYPVKSRKAGALPKAEQFNRVKCQNCSHYCVIAPGKRGICGVRENRNGKLYSLAYGKACACNIDPIEKKPFFHFLPGTYSLSVAAVGCNFVCPWCQNWEISQGPKPDRSILGENLLPEKIVETALKKNLPSISYTYTEPTVFLEYALDTMKLAKKEGLKNAWVSNGFLSRESAKLVIPCLDAINIDIKSFSDKFYQENCRARLKPVLETAKLMKKSNVWVEITTLAIPGLSDSEEMFKKIAKFIYQELGPETPWHITRFSGQISWKLQHLPDTPVKTLKMGYEIGKEAGLKYVYTGNVPGLDQEHTFCPKCGAKTIERTGYIVRRYDRNGKCSGCGEGLDIMGRLC